MHRRNSFMPTMDPLTERNRATIRDVIALALLVWGCAVLDHLTIESASSLRESGVQAPILVGADVIVLLISVILTRKRLAGRLTAKEPPTDWQVGAQQIQLTAIQCLGVCLAAWGLYEIQWCDAGTPAWRLARCLRLGPQLALPTEAAATLVIGLLLTFAARPLNALLVRDQRRQTSHPKPS